MLCSMTGFGAARREAVGLTAAVEVRSLNNRYLKVVVRGTEPYPMYEAEIERVVRRTVRRGTVTVHIGVERVAVGGLRLPAELLRDYLQQIRTACEAAHCPEVFPYVASGVLGLPGLSGNNPYIGTPPQQEWALVEATLEEALQALTAMRQREGAAMAAELLRLRQAIVEELEGIRRRAPEVAADYRLRLLERLRQWLAEAGIEVEEPQLLREVALFAERSDIAEEIARLQAHLDQFAELVRAGQETGRRLEFLVQEMTREANTLGAKAADVAIARRVVEIKALLEKIREMVQNIE